MAIIATTFPDPAERARAIGVFGSVSGLSLALGPILGGALVDGFGWRAIFWVNVPIVAAAIVCTALFVPESRAARARRFDPVGQFLVVLVLGSVVYAIIESSRLGWTSPVILGLLAAAVLGTLGILGYEPRRADPLLELRLFRSVPFSAAIVMALCALCAFGAFLFVTTQYLQDVRGLSALATGLCLLPVGVLVVLLSPRTGRLVGTRGPRLPLLVAGTALALGGARVAVARAGHPAARRARRSICCSASSWAPSTRRSPTRRCPACPARWPGWPPRWPRPAGRPAPRLGVAISGTIVGPALARGGVPFTSAAHGVWWMVLGLGLGILVLARLSTGRWAMATAARAAALFDRVDRGAAGVRSGPAGRPWAPAGSAAGSGPR